MSSKQADTIRRMASYIDEHGWSRGRFFRADGSACLVGAYVRVGTLRSDSSVLPYLKSLIEEWHPEIVANLTYEGGGVAVFNDEYLQSKQDALDFLEKAAIAAEEKVV